MPCLRADGSSDGKRLRQLGHDRPDTSQMDILLPLLSPPIDGRYTLGVARHAGTTQQLRVAATTLPARQRALAANGTLAVDEAWTFGVQNGIGTLVLPTSSFWRIAFDWKAFLDRAFERLDSEKVPYLVIDVRADEGGDGAIGNQLLSHLIGTPLGYIATQSVSAYETIAPETQRHLNTWAPRFLDRSGAAVLVGEPSGGNFRGLNGGELAWVTLPNSGVAVDIPLLAARYTATTPDASVTPDIRVTPTFTTRAAGNDQAMQAVLAVIQPGLPVRK